MKKPNPKTLSDEVNPEELGARYWYERYCEQRAETESLKKRVSDLEESLESLSEKLRKLTQRNSQNSSQPPSSDGYKKPSRPKKKPGRKRGPKYNHPGKTRNGFGYVDEKVVLEVGQCPNCGADLEVEAGKVKRQQVVELVPKLVEVKEYERPGYHCQECHWQGQADLPVGCQEGFSYGGRLSSLVGWLGYGGNLSWSKQREVVKSFLGVPLSQGSLCQMQSVV